MRTVLLPTVVGLVVVLLVLSAFANLALAAQAYSAPAPGTTSVGVTETLVVLP